MATRMTKQTAKTLLNIKRFTLSLAAGLVLTGCTSSWQKSEFRDAQREVDNKNYEEALKTFTRVIRRNAESDIALEAARKASRIALLETKNYPLAHEFFHHIVLYSPSEVERLDAQKKIASLLFENLLNYQQAIVEYQKLLTLNPSPEEAFEYRFNIAKSYFQMNNFYQAAVEVDDIMDRGPPSEHKFDLLLFKGSLLLTEKKLDEAIATLTKLDREFPERSKKEGVGLNLAVCYEEKGDFNRAIEILEKVKLSYQNPEFIELKIKRLKERRENLPGAQGLKK